MASWNDDAILVFSADASAGFADFSATGSSGLTFVANSLGNANAALSVATGSYLSLNDVNIIPSAGARSVALWVKTTDRSPFFSMGGCYSNRQWDLRYTGLDWAAAYNRLRSVDGSQDEFLDDGVWHHFAVVQDALGNTRFYIDGSVRYSMMYSNVFLEQPFSLYGSVVPNDFLYLGHTCTGSMWTGTLDDVRVYNRKLSSYEVGALALPKAVCSGGSSYSYGSATCASCSTGASSVSAADGCRSSATLTAGPADTVFYLSGSSTEGASAFPTMSAPAGIAFAAGPFNDANGALALTRGSYLSAPGPSSPSALPSGGSAAFSASAWVKCAAPSTWWTAMLEWGATGVTQSGAKISLAVRAANSIAGVRFVRITNTNYDGFILNGID